MVVVKARRADMPADWSQKPQFGRLFGKLAATDEHEFQRAIRPLLQVIDPRTIEAPKRGSADRCGADHLVWEHDGSFPLIVQTKGFRVESALLGRDQIRQCRESIRAFLESGLITDRYVLIYNRDGRSAEFRTTVLAALNELRLCGSAKSAELWDLNNLIDEAFEAMYRQVCHSFATRDLSVLDIAKSSEHPNTEVVDLPFIVETLEINQWGEPRQLTVSGQVADPWAQIDVSREAARILVLGEFGMGKTTTVLRGLRRLLKDFKPLFVSASSIESSTGGSRDFVSQCVDLEIILQSFQDNSLQLLPDLAIPAVERIFFNSKSGVVLLLDALDESSIIYHREGMQRLFNFLHDSRIPIVLTMRTELWNQRLADFSKFSGPRSKLRPTRRRQTLTKIELLPWNEEQIRQLTRDRISIENNDQARIRLTALDELVSASKYHQLFGDIPCRPLYLQWLLDFVAEEGMQALGRARLIEITIRRKIHRDRDALGRVPIAGFEISRDETERIAWAAMTLAAELMTIQTKTGIELLPHCSAEEIMDRDRRLRQTSSSLGLVLNSVLVPTRDLRPGAVVYVRFAHRVFQEYFLAIAAREQPDKFPEDMLPKEVRDWLNEMGGRND